jgi:outer membrane protein OmpA-like peptidoglycan-associated protein
MQRLLLLVISLSAGRAFGDATIPATTPAADRDCDGVADAVDLCPDEPEDRDGFADDDGCPDPDYDDCSACIGERIHFRPGTSKLLPIYYADLDHLGARLAEDRDLRLIEVRAHAGPGGHLLARRRAQAVRAYLINRGVAARRLIIRVYNDNERFVDFRILDKKPPPGG